MRKDNINDENYGTRDKRGNWKPFGTISMIRDVSNLLWFILRIGARRVV